MGHGRQAMDSSKFWDETRPHQNGSARLSPCHLQNFLIPRTSRNVRMCTVWKNMWNISYRAVQKKKQVDCKLRKRLNAIFISVPPSYEHLTAIKVLINKHYGTVLDHVKHVFIVFKGAFTPVEHSLRTFENVWKRFETFKNIRKHAWTASVHTAWATSTSSCSQTFDTVPTWHPGYQNFPFVLRR